MPDTRDEEHRRGFFDALMGRLFFPPADEEHRPAYHAGYSLGAAVRDRWDEATERWKEGAKL